ncbi:retrovirus-related pol polyprotein from transposon TNT 1-94 [Tanacetum coccineum]
MSETEPIPPTSSVTALRIPIIKKGEYDLWSMKMRQYIAITDHILWDIITNGNQTTTDPASPSVSAPKTSLAANARRNNEKALNILLSAIPDRHLLSFHDAVDARSLWKAIKARFGGNEASKKMQKNLLKQQFETFTIGSREELDSAYERFQHILSMLELHDATVSIEDANLKFLRSLPSVWHVVATMIRGQPGLDELDFDDLYNNLKVYEHELKGVSNSNSQNIAFLSTEVKGSTLKQSTAEPAHIPKGYTQAISSKVPTAPNCASHSDEIICSFFAQQASMPTTHDDEDLLQIDEDAMEEIDIRWQVAMITARIRKFMRKTGRPIDLKPKNGITFDKSKIECFNYSNSKALVATDNNDDIDWTKEFDAEPVTYAMMALTEVEQDDWSMEFDAEHMHFGQDGLGDFDWSNTANDTPVSLALMATNSELDQGIVLLMLATGVMHIGDSRFLRYIDTRPNGQDKSHDNVGAIERLQQKNLALIAKYSKKLYKPTNNNLRNSFNQQKQMWILFQWYKNDNQDWTVGNQGWFLMPRLRPDAEPLERIKKLTIVEWHNYKHLEWITVHRDEDKLYTFKEGDYNRLRLQDIEDMLLLLVQDKLTNLNIEKRLALGVSLRMFTRSIVIRRRVKDLQLGIKSFIYHNKDKKNRLMRIDELHKFSDGTLNDVRSALDDILKRIRMEYLPQTVWRNVDRERAGAMIQAIDRQLRNRRLMRSLEKFIGGRLPQTHSMRVFGHGGKMGGKMYSDFNRVDLLDCTTHPIHCTVRFGNDQFAPILGYGDLNQGNIMIKRVYYVKGFNHNLFSVGQFYDANLEVAFRKSTCFVRDLQGNDLLTGNRGSDLYTISLQETTSSTLICFMAKASPTQAGLPKLKYVKDQLCSSCEMSKAKRSSFKSKVVPSSKGRLNLLHMDLCGPMRVTSINRKKYILVIVDDYSRYTWTLFLRSKDETPEVLKDFLTMIQRNLQAQVITVRTDRGTEFLNKTLHAYFKEEGIEH